jgi:hypothetical protein
MDLKHILFVGGNKDRLGSVKIRCEDIGRRLGCDCHFDAKLASDIPGGYRAYVCIKPNLSPEEIHKLSSRGLVIWDIIDHPPPSGLPWYIASTTVAARLFSTFGCVHIIPHQHCNYDKVYRPPGTRETIWVGHSHWYPTLENIDHKTIFIDGLDRSANVDAYLQGDICLNIRRSRPELDFHLKVNPGIKLINCIGFGIPSLSSEEPAYKEVGADCTIFCSPSECANWLDRLKKDFALYGQLQKCCREKAQLFHISHIVAEYRHFLASI